jgi:ubiquitin carboxyl-terminal hydrolase 8
MGGRVAEEFAKVCRDVWYGSASSATPSGLKFVIGQFAPKFAGWAQQDSHELITFMLDGLHEDLNLVRDKATYLEGVLGNGEDDAETAVKAWDRHLSRNRSRIIDLFHGQCRSQLKCPNCEKLTVVFDPYMSLQVPIPVNVPGSHSLYECFEMFTAPEELDEQNQWFCPNCRQFVCATKKVDIWKVPPILIIQLKRFVGSGYYIEKYDTPIDFPDEMDIGEFICNPPEKGSGKYRLFAVSEHWGGLGGGHYTAHAIVQNPFEPPDPDPKWASFDDSWASSGTGMHSSGAYVLFYEQVESLQIVEPETE